MISPLALASERDLAFVAVGRTLGLTAWPVVPVRWNRRLRRAGRAVITRRQGTIAAVIELSPAYFEVYPLDLAGILVHEAVHVGLALLERPFGHGALFRHACLGSGGRLHSRAMPGRVWRYRCPVCEHVVERRRRPSGDRWCASCAAAADRIGAEPFLPSRALILIGVRFCRAEDPQSGTPGTSPVVGLR